MLLQNIFGIFVFIGIFQRVITKSFQNFWFCWIYFNIRLWKSFVIFVFVGIFQRDYEKFFFFFWIFQHQITKTSHNFWVCWNISTWDYDFFSKYLVLNPPKFISIVSALIVILIFAFLKVKLCIPIWYHEKNIFGSCKLVNQEHG